jgi:hypothetical protein
MERATVRIVTDEAEQPAAPAQAPQTTALPPEAQPPITPPAPPQELEADLGGPALQLPTPEEQVAAEGGSLADKVRARYESMSATEEFPVPGWELADGRPSLILVARAYGDRKAWNTGVSN